MTSRSLPRLTRARGLMLNAAPDSPIELKCGGIPLVKGHIGRVGPFVAVKVDKTFRRAGALGLTVAGGSDRAAAQGAKEVVLVNWGGIANEGFGNFYGKPFEARTPGVKTVMDSSGPSAGKIRAMVESKKVNWDLCDSSAGSSILLGNAGLLEPIDYTIVKKEDLPPVGFAYPGAMTARAVDTSQSSLRDLWCPNGERGRGIFGPWQV